VKPIRALLVYLTVVFSGAALAAPWVYRLVQNLAPGSGIALQPFHRYVNRCLLVLALAGLWPLLRFLNIRSRTTVGWVPISGQGRNIRLGFALGFASLALAACLPMIAGARIWQTGDGAGQWLQHITNAALSAIVVSFLEELLFRGAVFGTLRRVHSFPSAALISASIYSLVHFFDRPAPPASVDAWTGWATLGQMLHGFTTLHQLVPGFFTLALAGGLLAWARERTGSLWFGIGLHAGWIFWLKAFGFLTREASPAATTAFWGSSRLYDGWPAFGVLAVIALFLAPRWRNARSP
jgi:membrane protease YdiL (CAAX protease family)